MSHTYTRNLHPPCFQHEAARADHFQKCSTKTLGIHGRHLAPVEKYIRNQASYHKKIAFEQEFLALLKKHNIEFDPRFVFG